nr:immunoglobulin light chain junction region [Macaca mulatta]
CQQYNTDPLTF